MERKKKVEKFEQIRREYEFGNSSIRGIAKKYGIHRRMVRQALTDAMPPERKRPIRERPRLGAYTGFIDEILEKDLQAPRKQRHTARRIYVRLKQEKEGCEVSEETVRLYVRIRKEEMGLMKRETFVPQSYSFGQEGQVDWYEAYADLGGERQKVQVFSIRSMASGGAYHQAYPRATQQAFLEAHEMAFEYFAGVFRLLRYDNLKSAVKKILRGHTREENIRFIAFRSHWKYEAEFCNPQKGNEKGGVEGEVGYFRRNHFVPIPVAEDFADLNRQLMESCRQDHNRIIGDRAEKVGTLLVTEQQYLLALAQERFELAETSFHIVQSTGCVRVRNNFYSVPIKAGKKVRVSVLPTYIEVWYEGRLAARHERSYQSGQQILDLEHYLDVLERKPGALAGSKPLAQWRASGRWPQSFDRIWQSLQKRHGKQPGTKQMIELLLAGRKHGYERLREAVEQALELGCTDAAAVLYLMRAEKLQHEQVPKIDIQQLAQYERPLPVLSDYDRLLGRAAKEGVA